MDTRMEETLQEEQEGMLSKHSQILPESSSQETILTREDREKIAENELIYFEANETLGMEASAATEDVKKECIPCKGGKAKGKKDGRKRGRPRKAQKVRTRGISKSDKSGGARDEIDSGFVTGSEQLLKGTQETNQKSFGEALKPCSEKETYFDPLPSDSEGSCKSVESIALLQTAETTDKPGSLEEWLKTAENVKLYPSTGKEDEIAYAGKHVTDKSVQTVYPVTPPERFGEESTDFVSSIIKLKYLPLKIDVTAKSYADIINDMFHRAKFSTGDEWEGMTDVEEEEDSTCDDGPSSPNGKMGNLLSQEATNYIVKTANAEYVMLKSVQSILGHLKAELEGNCEDLCDFWHDSPSSNAIDTIIGALHSDPGFIRSEVSNFLKGIFHEISCGETPVEDSVWEYKISFLSNFCKSSPPLSFDLAGHVLEKLSKLKKASPECKLNDIREVKASYFALRLLKDLLRTLSDNLPERKTDDIFRRGSQENPPGVFNLLGNRWRNREASNDSDGEREKYIKHLMVVNDWCRITNQVFDFFLNECPILSFAAVRCTTLAREMFRKIQM